MTGPPVDRDLWPSLFGEIRPLLPGSIEVAETDDVLEYGHFATGICVSLRLASACVVVSASSELLDPSSTSELMSEVAHRVETLVERPAERIDAHSAGSTGVDHAYVVVGDGGERPTSSRPVMLAALPSYDRRGASDTAPVGRRRWFGRDRRRSG
ncbi:hypothetical protein [Ilumatobacter sp.]|uniref:hypothetical protein n=1 Tax=Ilumatobacter sp. TaxID=1967498 RepID=UPI003B51B148